MKSLLDTNVILDVLLAREPFLADSQAIWLACENGQIRGYIAASSLTDIYYIARRIAGPAEARKAVDICLTAFTVSPIDELVLRHAFQLAGKDFEDDVLIATAAEAGIDAIVTRNPSDFAHSPIAVYTPASLLQLLTINQASNE